MLITFKSAAAGNVTMFGDVATALLKMMGQSGVSPGAILAPDVPKALAKLKAAVAQIKTTGEPPPTAEDEARGEGEHVSLAVRAVPLIDFLERSAAEKADVTWGT